MENSTIDLRILTFDLEDWFHILDYEGTSSDVQWRRYKTRIFENIEILLAFLEEKKQKATFFALGWIVENYPDVIKLIEKMGHEIGTHSHMHQLVYKQTKKEFAWDLELSIKRIEDILGKKIRCYRAPGFSITPDTPWAFEALLKMGIEVDSSLFISRRAHGGYHKLSEDRPFFIKTNGMLIKEFPVVPYKKGMLRIMFSGGGYFRLMPYILIKTLTKRCNYLMTYFHYRDFDCGQPVIEGLSLYRRFKCYVGIRNAMGKLNRLLEDFKLIDIQDADRIYDWSKAAIIEV
jgi:peptidoglycan-N-acetylglucosamine deacetylase